PPHLGWGRISGNVCLWQASDSLSGQQQLRRTTQLAVDDGVLLEAPPQAYGLGAIYARDEQTRLRGPVEIVAAAGAGEVAPTLRLQDAFQRRHTGCVFLWGKKAGTRIAGGDINPACLAEQPAEPVRRRGRLADAQHETAYRGGVDHVASGAISGEQLRRQHGGERKSPARQGF